MLNSARFVIAIFLLVWVSCTPPPEGDTSTLSSATQVPQPADSTNSIEGMPTPDPDVTMEGNPAPELPAPANSEVNSPPPESDSPTVASLSIARIEVVAGTSQQLLASFEDMEGNNIRDAKVTWTLLDSNAGSVTPFGLFTAAEVARTYGGAVSARSEEFVESAG